MTPRLKSLPFVLVLLVIGVFGVNAECPEFCSCSVLYKPNSDEPINNAKCKDITGLKGDYGKRSNLNSLDLSELNLHRMTINLENFKHLTELNLSKNNLTEVSKLNKRITNLDLSHNLLTSNKLSKIPEYVQHLNLAHNMLTSIPDDIMKLTNLQSLELSDNPINCDCDTIVARNWLQDHHIWSTGHVKCRTPEKYESLSWFQVKESDVCHFGKKSSDGFNWKFDDDDELMMADSPSVIFEGSGGPAIEELGKEYISVPLDVKVVNENLDSEDDGGSGDDDFNSTAISTHGIVGMSEDGDGDEGSGDDGSGAIFIPRLLLDLIPSTSPEPSSSTTSDDDLLDLEGSPAPPYDTPGIFEEDASEASPSAEVETSSPKPETESIAGASNVLGASKGDIKTPPPAEEDANQSLYILLAIIGIVFIALVLIVAFRRKKSTPAKQTYDPEAANQRGKELQSMDRNKIGKPVEYIPLMGEKPVHKPPNAADTPKLHSFKPKPSDDEVIREPLLKSNDEPEPKPTQNGKSGSKSSLYENMPPPQVEPPIPAARHITPATASPPSTLDSIDHPKTIPESHQNGHHAPNPYEDDVFLPNNTTPPADEQHTPEKAKSPSSPTNLSTSRYSPVYSPETGRVKVKLMHTPKPKTPLLVNRTRSPTGEIIDTPASYSPRSPRNN